MSKLYIYILLFFLVCCHFISFAQVPPKLLAEWRRAEASDVVFNPNEDAEIVFNKVYEIFRRGYENKMNYTFHYTAIHRRVKIHSQRGLKDFNTIYIPLLEDVTEQDYLIAIKGRTIKQDGTIIEIEPEFIQETTLPANVPFLYGYDGKVQMFAFQNLELGDEIEYYYTILEKDVEQNLYYGKERISKAYPIHESKYIFDVNKNLVFESKTQNIDSRFTNGRPKDMGVIYQFKATNVPANRNELYDNDNYSQPYFTYIIRSKRWDEDYNKYNSWNELANDTKIRRVRRSYLIDGIRVKHFGETAELLPTEQEKVDSVINKINRIVRQSFKNNPNFLYVMEPDLYDALQVMKVFEELNINVAIIAMRDKAAGPINKKDISFGQFHDFLIEYTGKDGKKQWFPLFRPYDKPGYLYYPYEGATALKIYKDKDEKQAIFTEVKSLYSVDNKLTTVYDFDLTDAEWMKVNKSVEAKGQFFNRIKIPFLANQMDSIYDYFTLNEFNNLRREFWEVENEAMTLEPLDMTTLTNLSYSLSFDCTNPERQGKQTTLLHLYHYMPFDYHIDMEDQQIRTEDLHFNFPYVKEYTMRFKVNPSLKMYPNEALNVSKENNLASFKSNYKMISKNEMVITYRFELKKSFAPKEEWSMFTEVRKAAYDFSRQKVVCLKE